MVRRQLVLGKTEWSRQPVHFLKVAPSSALAALAKVQMHGGSSPGPQTDRQTHTNTFADALSKTQPPLCASTIPGMVPPLWPYCHRFWYPEMHAMLAATSILLTVLRTSPCCLQEAYCYQMILTEYSKQSPAWKQANFAVRVTMHSISENLLPSPSHPFIDLKCLYFSGINRWEEKTVRTKTPQVSRCFLI